MRVKEAFLPDFNDNYHGVLTHDGCFKVAKANITGKILNIQDNNVLVKGKTHSYVCEIHKDLYPLMDFVEDGDTAFIKWSRGKSWFVGFQKKNFDNHKPAPTGDKAVSENTNWLKFFKEMELE